MDDPADWKDDQLFEPSVDMMVNDFDDEATLEEEENLANQEGNEENEVNANPDHNCNRRFICNFYLGRLFAT